jgi:hypothetical protein
MSIAIVVNQNLIAKAHVRQQRLVSYIEFIEKDLLDFKMDYEYDCIFCMIGGIMRELQAAKLVAMASKFAKACKVKVYVRGVVKEKINTLLNVI